MMKSNFKNLDSLLSSIIKKHNIEDEYRLFKVEQAWKENISPQLLNVAAIVKVDGKILTIKTASSQWREELEKYSDNIIQKINEAEDLGIEYIKII